MRTLAMINEQKQAAGRHLPAGPPAGWLKLVCWLLLIWFFIFVAAPTLKKIPAINTLATYIDRSGIDAGAIYYTEVEEVGQADLAIRNTFRFYLDEE